MKRRRYRVVGRHRVFGHEPGSTFSAALPAEQEARLVRAGHIEIVAKGGAKKEKD